MVSRIFKDDTAMTDQRDSLDPVTPVTATRLTPSTNAKAGAQALYKLGPEYMDVVNCCRPRRGHDY